MFSIVLLGSCGQGISSKEEALSILINSEWEEITDVTDLSLGFDEVSTFYYFDSNKQVYIYSKKGGYNQFDKSKALSYEIQFKKGKHNVCQICINGCDNPNLYYLDCDNPKKITYFGNVTKTLNLIN